MIQYVREALDVLLANRARSFLTALGLIIGVAAVISIQVLGSGTATAVTGVLNSLNDRSFTLVPDSRQTDFTRAQIRPEDIERARSEIEGIAEAIPAAGTTQLARLGHVETRMVIGGESDQRFVTTPVQYGRAFTRDDVAGAEHVAMLSHDGYMRLFPDGGDPTGKSMRLGDRRYVIVGVLEQPKTGIIPNIVRADAFLPYTTYREDFLRGKTVFAARFLIAPGADLIETEHRTIAYFRNLKRGHVSYQTFDRKSLTGAVDGIFGGLTLVVAFIGAISLLVAGIGILNIMLVSVAERTREIGVRKAIGATRFQVLAQFFIEALLLSALGCAAGLALGLAVGYAIARFGLVAISGVVPALPWLRSILIATGFATVVTLAFGTYPAYRAASLDPIESLRYE